MNPYDLPVGRIEELVAKHGTPLYIVSREKLLENYNRLNRCLPAVTLFYAVKTNQHEGILEILKNAGAGFDVASRGEIMDAVHAGANPREDLIFADTVKDPKHIAHAFGIGLDDFTFDNPSEITQIARHAPGANVHVRIMVSNKGSVAHLSDKFGAEIKEAVPLLLEARDQGLVPRGVSFHVGSQCLDPQRYVDALDQTRGVFDEAAKHGLDLEMIDIGGGFPVKYEGEKIDIEGMCAIIDTHYRKLFGTEIKLVAEPGRAIVGDAVILVTKVISESVRKGKNWLYFDDGTYGSFMEVLLYQMRFPMKTNTDGPLRKYVLAGPTCDSIDVFSRNKKGRIKEVELPEMHLDDLLIAGSMGAYTYSESTRFNGFEPPGFVYID
ncbi:MAG: type III PLP-dependent enzyme [Candidatus Krumholzibacteria bacterium]|nr:type III PLP-dependent enzyme [Candidatus Krumholzibacteria bacterium]